MAFAFASNIAIQGVDVPNLSAAIIARTKNAADEQQRRANQEKYLHNRISSELCFIST